MVLPQTGSFFKMHAPATKKGKVVYKTLNPYAKDKRGNFLYVRCTTSS